MSPWGKFYLANVDYRPGWWDPFHSWRMHYFGMLWRWPSRRAERHLDAIERELCRLRGAA